MSQKTPNITETTFNFKKFLCAKKIKISRAVFRYKFLLIVSLSKTESNIRFISEILLLSNKSQRQMFNNVFKRIVP